jgi:hypothetical protein
MTLPVNAQKYIHGRPDLPGPPDYPATFDVSPRPAIIPGNVAYTQTQTILTPTGTAKRTVVPGWDNPVNFTSND